MGGRRPAISLDQCPPLQILIAHFGVTPQRRHLASMNEATHMSKPTQQQNRN